MISELPMHTNAQTDMKEKNEYKLISDEITDHSYSDDNDVNEDNVELDIQYAENFWQKDEENPSGYSFKGKKPTFVKAVENLKILFKKGTQKQMRDLSFRVLDSRKTKSCVEADIEILKLGDRGNATLKIYGPNGKNECTLMVTKCKKQDVLFVKILATEIVKPLVDSFVTGEGWKTKFLENTKNKSKDKFNCGKCDKTFNTVKALTKHVNSTHDEAEKTSKVVPSENKVVQFDVVTPESVEVMEIDEFALKEIKQVVDVEKMDVQEISIVKNNVNVKDSEKVMCTQSVTEIPFEMEDLIDGDCQVLVVPSDGVCAVNAVAAHVFNDAKLGPEVNTIKHKHVVDNWQFYKDKFWFPFKRKVGVKGAEVEFAEGEDEKFLQFLQSEDSKFLWSDSNDLQALCNMYQVNIKVIKIYQDGVTKPEVHLIGPDEELVASRMIPKGVIPDMTLVNYNEKHFNLVIPRVTSTKDDAKPKYAEANNVANKLEFLEKRIEKSEIVTNSLKQDILYLRNKLISANESEKSMKSDVASKPSYLDITTLPVNSNRRSSIFECTVCNAKFPKEDTLKIHMRDTHGKEVFFSCIKCSFRSQNETTLKKHYAEDHNELSPNKSDPVSMDCHSCGEKFDTKRNLMDHRRDYHKHLSKLCRYYMKGECEFDDQCWYRHETSSRMKTVSLCNNCDETFVSKSELAIHMNEKHAQNKVVDSVFQNTQTSTKPPETGNMENLVNMMQMLLSQFQTMQGKLQGQ